MIKNNIYDIVLSINGNTDPFSLLGKTKISSDANIRGTFTSLYQFLKVIGIIGIFVSIIVCAIQIASTNANKREEGKRHLQTKGAIAIAIFSFIGILGIILDIIGGIV